MRDTVCANRYVPTANRFADGDQKVN